MELKLVSALTETKCLFRLFWFLTETASFVFWLNRNNKKPTETNPKEQIDSIKIEAYPIQNAEEL